MRWGNVREKYKKQSKYINKAKETKGCGEYIKGVDAANYEYNCRPEVFGNVFREHRVYDENIGITYHAGEDFPTICNGIRAIYETIEFLGLKENDRLGHALALGLDCFKYFEKQRNIVTCSLQDYLDDIAWMYFILNKDSKLNIHDKQELTKYLYNEFEENKKLLYEGVTHGNFELDKITIEDYIDSIHLRGDNPCVIACNYAIENVKEKYEELIRDDGAKINYKSINHEKAFKNKCAREIYYVYEFNAEIYKKGKQIVVKKINNSYIVSVVYVQAEIQELVKEKEIIIEANPSSNRKISPIEKFIDLPLFRLNDENLMLVARKNVLTNNFNFKTHLVEGNDMEMEYVQKNLRICVNTDDSGIFQTTLNREYELIAAALDVEGEKKEDIRKYLNYLAKQSLSASFLSCRGESSCQEKDSSISVKTELVEA